ncbi:type II toxin-antitoxin system RelB/DinJ family antitoxin, partial [Adlercreutzia sp. DFI.6.23]|uniref:type II toxin-antitoxin system RelB/DinJ family antitoxin n=1 Tax=Adlercreutzia sp. DFI.6.23 TaxID=2963705 RepID=UPI00210C42A8
VVEHYGLDISTAMRAFLTQIVNTNAIPLSLDYEQQNEESLIAIRETKEMITNGSGESYSNAHDLIQAALA